jgi:hypothetical protein
MNVLVVRAGVIGTVYGAHLGACGHAVSVLAYDERTEAIAHEGLRARDVLADTETHTPATVIDLAGEQALDVVLVAVCRDNLDLVVGPLTSLPGRPLLLFLGNNSKGRAGLAPELAGRGAPRVPRRGRGDERSGCRVCAHISTPTRLEKAPEPRLEAVHEALKISGFEVQRSV